MTVLRVSTILGTTTADRRQTRAPYVVVLGSRPRSAKGVTAVSRSLESGRTLTVYAGLVVDTNDAELAAGVARVDQSVRSALGLNFRHEPTEESLEFSAVDRLPAARFRDWLARLSGTSFVFARVASADVRDMEKGLARLPSDTIALLGTRGGQRIVVESVEKDASRSAFVIRQLRLRALELPSEILEQRSDPQLANRYPNPRVELGIHPDIPAVLIDKHAREALGVEALDPVLIRRDGRSLYLQEFREFGIVFFLSVFTIVSVLPLDPSWGVTVGAAAVSVVIAALLTFFKIRGASGR
jgi:hypothetical protein